MKQLSYLILVICIGFISFLSCQGEVGRQNPAKLNAISATGETGVALKALDDSANPYRDQYREWDNWIYKQAMTGPVAWRGSEEPENWTHCTTRVDDNGWLVPSSAFVREREEAMKAGSYDEFCEEIYYLSAEGEMDPDLLQQMQQEEWLVRAEYYPRIPDWFGENPSKCAMFIPDGRIVTYGPVGSYVSAHEIRENEGFCCGSRGYYLYDQDGKELNKSECTWFYLFYGLEREWPEGECTGRKDGYFIFRDRLTDEILQIYDYDGTLLDTRIPPPMRDMHNFQMVPAFFISQLYEAQRANAQ